MLHGPCGSRNGPDEVFGRHNLFSSVSSLMHSSPATHDEGSEIFGRSGCFRCPATNGCLTMGSLARNGIVGTNRRDSEHIAGNPYLIALRQSCSSGAIAKLTMRSTSPASQVLATRS